MTLYLVLLCDERDEGKKANTNVAAASHTYERNGSRNEPKLHFYVWRLTPCHSSCALLMTCNLSSYQILTNSILFHWLLFIPIPGVDAMHFLCHLVCFTLARSLSVLCASLFRSSEPLSPFLFSSIYMCHLTAVQFIHFFLSLYMRFHFLRTYSIAMEFILDVRFCIFCCCLVYRFLSVETNVRQRSWWWNQTNCNNCSHFIYLSLSCI